MRWVYAIRKLITSNRWASLFFLLVISHFRYPFQFRILFIFVVFPTLVIGAVYIKAALQRWWKSRIESLLTQTEVDRAKQLATTFTKRASLIAVAYLVVVYFVVNWSISLPFVIIQLANQLLLAAFAAVFLPGFLYYHLILPTAEIDAFSGIPLYGLASILFAYYGSRAIATWLLLRKTRPSGKTLKPRQ